MASFMVDENTGYIDVGRFASTTHDELRAALEKLGGEGMERLVLDLRGNPGGYLEQAVRIADEFIGGNKVIVKTKGRVSAFDDVDLSTPGQRYESMPLVVLIDQGSASASEIVSGAIQDHDRGLVVGQTSFGKGLVQRQFPLNDGSALRLTISRYYTPSDRSIQKPYEGNKYAKKGSSLLEDGEDEVDNTEHSREAADTTRPKYKTMGGRTVLGGGGVTPDFLVKNDTTQHTTRRMIAASVIYDYLQSYVGRNAASLKKQYDAKSYEKSFKITDAMYKEIIDMAKDKKVEFVESEFNIDKAWLGSVLRAEIGGRLFGNDLRYKILLETDKQFQKAYNLIGEAAKMASKR
jgi:carboxyl-terminal processing protease